MRVLIVTIALLVSVSLANARTVGDVLDETVEQQGRSMGATQQQIGEIQNAVKGAIPKGFSDDGWTILAPFENVYLPAVNVPKTNKSVTLWMTPDQLNKIDKSKPESFGGSLRSYRAFVGRGTQGTAYVLLKRIFSKVELKVSQTIPSEGLVVNPVITGYRFKLNAGLMGSLSYKLDMTMNVYNNGVLLSKDAYSLDWFKGPEKYHAISDKAYSKNAEVAFAKLFAKTQNQLYSYAQSAPDTQTASAETAEGMEMDVDKVELASLSWDDYKEHSPNMTKQERDMARTFLAFDKAYKDSRTDDQAELLSEMRGFVSSNNIEPASREMLLAEIKSRMAMREVQQKGINDFDDDIYNFAGDNTGLVLDVAEVVPDVAKTGVLIAGCSNPVTCTALLGTMASYETAEKVAKVTGSASAEYFSGSGELDKAAWEGTKTFIADYAGGKITKAFSTSVVSKYSGRQAKRVLDVAQKRGYSEDLSRYIAGQAFVKNADKVLPSVEKSSGILIGKGTDYMVKTADEMRKNYNKLQKKSKPASKSETAPDFTSMKKM